MTRATDLITAERARQMSDEGWTPEHDDEHTDGSLALAAACYATPVRIYEQNAFAGGVSYVDPWPWERLWDKRYRYGERRNNRGNVLPDPSTYNNKERIDLLVKAGALIAAEIDRILRTVPPADPTPGGDEC